MKATGGNARQFLELIGSVVVAVPADYTRYEPNVRYMEMAREIVKNGSAARHRYGRQLAPRSPDLAQFTKPATDDFNTLGNQPFRLATVMALMWSKPLCGGLILYVITLYMRVLEHCLSFICLA